MDKLFTYESEEMIEKLKAVEPEMYEDSYSGSAEDLDEVSVNAISYIVTIWSYMKNTWKADACTVLALVKELYRVASTGEYSYLQQMEDLLYKNDLFECMLRDSGEKEVLYAVRLLRYYYLLKEKRYHSVKVWNELNLVYQKVCSLKRIRKTEKKGEEDEMLKKLTEMEFMLACRCHMDKHYVGQDLLKKKLCSALTQWKYHDVRTTLLMIGPSGSGKNYMIETLGTFSYLGMPIISYDCSNLTPAGFIGASVNGIFKKVKKVMAGRKTCGKASAGDTKCIVYLDEIDKIINWNHDGYGENVNAVVQQQLLSALAGTETIEDVDTSKVLFILGGAFPRIDDLKKDKSRNPLGFSTVKKETIDIRETIRDQMIAIGAEVEFVGRIEDIVRLSKLTRDDLRTILMDEHIGAFTKKKKIYKESGLNLEIEDDTVEAIVDLIEKEDAGARSVKNIMNQFADNSYFYDMKVGGYSCMKIHKGMLYGEKPIFVKGGEMRETCVRTA